MPVLPSNSLELDERVLKLFSSQSQWHIVSIFLHFLMLLNYAVFLPFCQTSRLNVSGQTVLSCSAK